MILNDDVTLRNHVPKGLYSFMGGSPSEEVTNLPCMVSIGLVQVEIQNIYFFT